MGNDQQQFVSVYKQEFQKEAGKASKDDDNTILNKLKQANVQSPEQAKQQAKKDAQSA